MRPHAAMAARGVFGARGSGNKGNCTCASRDAPLSVWHAGDGGNVEGVYKTFAATDCTCPLGTSSTVCPCANVTQNLSPAYCSDLRVFEPGQQPLFAPLNGTQPD